MEYARYRTTAGTDGHRGHLRRPRPNSEGCGLSLCSVVRVWSPWSVAPPCAMVRDQFLGLRAREPSHDRGSVMIVRFDDVLNTLVYNVVVLQYKYFVETIHVESDGFVRFLRSRAAAGAFVPRARKKKNEKKRNQSLGRRRRRRRGRGPRLGRRPPPGEQASNHKE
jgi:hypothetical protein